MAWEGHPACRTSPSHHLCSLLSSLRCFSTLSPCDLPKQTSCRSSEPGNVSGSRRSWITAYAGRRCVSEGPRRWDKTLPLQGLGKHSPGGTRLGPGHCGMRGGTGVLQFPHVFMYALGHCEGGSAVAIVDASTPSRTSKTPGGEAHDILSHGGVALSTRTPCPAGPGGGALLGSHDRGYRRFCSACVVPCCPRLRPHASHLQDNDCPPPCVARSSAVSRLSALVSGQERHDPAASCDLPAAHPRGVPAACCLSWLWH
jgi:hypothetical protein